MTNNQLFDEYKRVAKAIGHLLSPFVETVVHDFSTPKKSIIAIYNGHISGRKLGGRFTEFGYKKAINPLIDDHTPYESSSDSGQKLKSVTIPIRDKKNKTIGSFSVNMNIDYFESLRGFINQIIDIPSMTEEDISEKESAFVSVHTDITNDIQRMIKEKGWSQQPLNKKQKIELIHLAKEKGHFMKRGSVKIVGEYLSLTPPTIYKYMKDT